MSALDCLSDVQRRVYNVLMNMSVEDAVGAFLDYHGWQLVNDGFAQHLVDEGYAEEDEVGIAEDDDTEPSEQEREDEWRELMADVEREERGR